jgi:predicted nucleotidyltransferase
MLSDAQLRAAAGTRPATVIVFGSYARGEASAASDLDRAVVEPTKRSSSTASPRTTETIVAGTN